jgi:hypothetical protein
MDVTLGFAMECCNQTLDFSRIAILDIRPGFSAYILDYAEPGCRFRRLIIFYSAGHYSDKTVPSAILYTAGFGWILSPLRCLGPPQL